MYENSTKAVFKFLKTSLLAGKKKKEHEKIMKKHVSTSTWLAWYPHLDAQV